MGTKARHGNTCPSIERWDIQSFRKTEKQTTKVFSVFFPTVFQIIKWWLVLWWWYWVIFVSPPDHPEEVAYGLQKSVKSNPKRFAKCKMKTEMYNYHLNIKQTLSCTTLLRKTYMSTFCVDFKTITVTLRCRCSAKPNPHNDIRLYLLNPWNKYVFLQPWLWGLWGWRLAAAFWTRMKGLVSVLLIYLEAQRLFLCKPLKF